MTSNALSAATYTPILEEWNGVIAHLDVIIRYKIYQILASHELIFVLQLCTCRRERPGAIRKAGSSREG